ncbi:O-methyltransferase asqD [Cladobotryum mycophilum]|uniref:O-methyltransferase asqD n=1 Tax=Cladobotryum mycophilum TaxID=491253 RepID=A0ABR0SR50_9HYPO
MTLTNTSAPGQAAAVIDQLCDLKGKLDDPNARQKALQLSRALATGLEDPVNVAIDRIFAPFISVAARIAVDLGLFKHIANHGSPITSKELAKLSGGEELLIIRILRPLSSTGMVAEVSEMTWTGNAVTHVLATDAISSGYRMVGDMIIGAAQKSPKYFREAGYRCPTNPNDGFMQYAFQTKLNVFEFFASMPDVLQDFNGFMGNTMGARGYWTDWFPVERHLLKDYHDDSESALLVDVGAGRGHDILAFQEKYSGKGRLVLQDLAVITDSLDGIDPGIECMAHDFFTEQPVKGARAYFYHHILHDWSDEKCLEILAELRKAMKPGYSKLLIHEMILPEQGAATFYSMLDMTMMSFNSGMERSKRLWTELIDKAGLKVVKFWSAPEEGADGIIEVILEA